MNRFPSSRCASAIQIVRPRESSAETQPQLQPALLRLLAITSQNFTLIGLCRFCSPHSNDKVICTDAMIRSLAFTTQGRLHSKNLDMFLMPTLLSDTNLFLWVDLEKPTPEETKYVLEDVFHFHPLSIEDCVMLSPSPKVEEYTPKEEDTFAPYLFMVIHAVDYSRKDGVFATSELNFFLGKNFLVTWHQVPLRSIQMASDQCLKSTVHIARAPDRVAHTLLDSIVENYKPALDELSLEIGELEQQALQHPTRETLNKIHRSPAT